MRQSTWFYRRLRQEGSKMKFFQNISWDLWVFIKLPLSCILTLTLCTNNQIIVCILQSTKHDIKWPDMWVFEWIWPYFLICSLITVEEEHNACTLLRSSVYCSVCENLHLFLAWELTQLSCTVKLATSSYHYAHHALNVTPHPWSTRE